MKTGRKGEVQKALSRARGLFDRWEELLQEGTQVSRDELDWSANELRNCLRAIDWDLEDLSETISIVESNPGKFKLGENELQERRDFVERTRKSVQEMKDHLSSPSAVAQAEKKNRQEQDRSTGLEAHLVSANSRYIQEQQEQQQLIMQEQDEQLELVSGSIRVLKDMSGRIGDELDEQAVGYVLSIHPSSSAYLRSGRGGSSLSRETQTSLSPATWVVRWNPKAFPGQLRNIVPPVCPGSSSVPGRLYQGGIQKAS
ncbi:Syntaxin-10 [Ilyodon furcidens]|uniref:Syntaxin-10 n=1 Tax=Ilyodon furcidens TaxID=33524 RepID=A0ABV0SUM9_9TELE